MNWYKIIKSYYDRGLWTIDQVKVAVEKGKITEDELQNIIVQNIDTTEEVDNNN